MPSTIAPVQFADLRSAGRELAAALEPHAGRSGTLVAGLVRGGVPAAAEVAAQLALPLDLLLLCAPLQRPDGGVARAVRAAGTLVLDEHLTGITPESTEGRYLAGQLEMFAARERLCRGERPALNLAGRNVILVDNGMRTGTTMRTAIEAVRWLGAAQVVAAVPVASPAARDAIGPLAVELVCLRIREPFGNVAMFYRRFDVPVDDCIRAFVT